MPGQNHPKKSLEYWTTAQYTSHSIAVVDVNPLVSALSDDSQEMSEFKNGSLVYLEHEVSCNLRKEQGRLVRRKQWTVILSIRIIDLYGFSSLIGPYRDVTCPFVKMHKTKSWRRRSFFIPHQIRANFFRRQLPYTQILWLGHKRIILQASLTKRVVLK